MFLGQIETPAARTNVGAQHRQQHHCHRHLFHRYMNHFHHHQPDMKFVQNSQVPDFEAKNFTPQKCVNCDILHRKSA